MIINTILTVIKMRRQDFLSGIKAAIPVVLGYIPAGLAFGVLAAQAGLGIKDVFFMSLLVFAGSSQFIATSLISAGASAGTIIAATFLVNLRHILLSASLAPHIRKINNWLLTLIGFTLTDESFAVAIGSVAQEEKKAAFFLGLNLTSYLSWIANTVLGAAMGNLIPNPELFGLHFALPAMFIGLLVMQMREKHSYLVAVLAMVLALVFKMYLPGNWYIILATVLSATIGVISESWKENISPSSSA